MTESTHREILERGIAGWNAWRAANPGITPSLAGESLTDASLAGADLHGADLSRMTLLRVDLRGADLRNADLRRSNLREADLTGADLTGAELYRVNLNRSVLADARLAGANLYRAYLSRADLRGADLRGAELGHSVLVSSDVQGCRLSGARVHGVAVWALKGTPADQDDLVITADDEPVITLDNLKVAQFIHLLLANEEIRGVIDTITSKVVLILGRFTPERKPVLDALRDALRTRDLSPVVFDFEIPQDRDITETVTLLARMARYVVADLTDPKSIPQELQAIAPDVAVPIQPIVQAGAEPWSMFRDLGRKYHWVLKPYTYASQAQLLASLDDVLAPAEAKRRELSGG